MALAQIVINASINGSSPSCSCTPDGFTVAIGANGLAQVYTRSGSVLTAKGSSISGGSAFGQTISISADGLVLAIGQPNATVSGFANAGAVYIYDWNGSAWILRSTLLPATPVVNLVFGRSVCLGKSDGSRLLICFGNGANNAQVQDWNGSAWNLQASIPVNTPNNTCACMSADGLVLSVSNANSGIVYPYAWDGSSWVARPTISNGAPGGFGQGGCLNADGTALWVGAVNYTTYSGQLYKYTWNGTAWVNTLSGYVAPGSANNWQMFCSNMGVSSSGNFLIAGTGNYTYYGMFGEQKTLSGTTKDASDTPLAAKVTALITQNFQVVASTTANGSTGVWSITTPYGDEKHLVISEYGTYNAVASDQVVPV